MKTFRRFLEIALGALPIFFLTALPAFAEEGAKPDPADSPTGLIFRWLNFLIVVGGIAYLTAKYGGAFFRGNAKQIAASIVEATAAKTEADHELHDVEVKIERLDQDVSEMREEAQRNWAAESERLRASGQAEIERSLMRPGKSWPHPSAPRSSRCARSRRPWRWSARQPS